MRVMILIKADQNSEAGIMPDTDLLTAMGRFNEELVNAGLMEAGEGLHPSSKGARVRFAGTARSVTYGPFTDTAGLIAGFWIWKVKSLEEAIEWVKRCPSPMLGESEIEIRRIFEAEDFGDALTPELRAQEDRLRAGTDEKKKSSARRVTEVLALAHHPSLVAERLRRSAARIRRAAAPPAGSGRVAWSGEMPR